MKKKIVPSAYAEHVRVNENINSDWYLKSVLIPGGLFYRLLSCHLPALAAHWLLRC